MEHLKLELVGPDFFCAREANCLRADGAVRLPLPKQFLEGGHVALGFRAVIGGGAERGDEVGEDVQANWRYS